MKRVILFTTTLMIGLAFAGSLLMTSAAQAQSAEETLESITLSPVSRKYKLNAGQTISESLTIVNDGKTAYDFVMYSRPYSVTNENYEPNFTNTPTNADAYGWVQFKQAKYHLEAGASTTVEYTIRVPAKAAPGGHYGVIFAETQPAQEQISGNAVVRKKRVGSIIYATVNGTYQTNGEIQGSDIPFWQLQPPLHATATASNGGNVDITNSTTYVIKDIFGNTKYSEKKDYVILPETTRKMVFDWKDASWFGFYKVELSQDLLDTSTTDTGYVLILPRYIPVLLVVLAVAGGAYAILRRKKH